MSSHFVGVCNGKNDQDDKNDNEFYDEEDKIETWPFRDKIAE